MKPSTALLLLSLAVNGLLLGTLNRRPPASYATITPQPLNLPASSGQSGFTPANPSAANEVAPAVKPTNTLWSTLQSDDLEEFRSRLRMAGFPANEIRAMLAMAIDAATAAKRDALVGKSNRTPYWQTSSGGVNGANTSSQLLEIYRDERTLRHRFVNSAETLADDEDELAAAQRRYGRLSLAKLQQLTELTYTLDDQRMLLSQNSQRDASQPSNEATRRAQSDAFRKLEQENLAAVTQLLTPDELLQYQLRNDGAGLAHSLQNFRPTEAEFKAIYTIHRQMIADLAPYASQANTSSTRDDAMAHLQNALGIERAQLQAALGIERAADLQAIQNSGSDKVGKLLARLELPPSTVNRINAVRDDINQRASAIRNDPQLQPAQRAAQLATLSREANEKLTATLGARGYAAYSDIKGEWIRALQTKGP